jgi:sensor histidine kinase YesM
LIVFLLLILVAIEIISAFKIADSTYHTILMSLSQFIYYLFSVDVINVLHYFGITPVASAAQYLDFLAVLFIVLSGLNFINYTYGRPLGKKAFQALLALSAIAAIIYPVLGIFHLQYIAYYFFVLSIIVFVVMVYKKVFAEKKDDATFYLSSSICCVAIGMGSVDVLYHSNLTPDTIVGYPSMHILLIISLYIGVYISFIIRTSREAFKAGEYKYQMERLKTHVLRQQINPHFIFNSLTAVKAMYHKDCASGDQAISLFSKHLRSNVEAMDTDVITFQRELDNVENFVELQNLGHDTDFCILYDIGFSEFMVPILSLQVFVENAIKYSGVEKKEDGYIEISSFEEGEFIVVQVNDNGVGFCPDEVKATSYGIKNATERFALLLGATVHVFSTPNEGTSINIRLPKQRCIVTQETLEK